MRKLLVLGAAAAIFLAACAPAPSGSAPVNATASPTVKRTTAPVAAQPTREPGCSVVSKKPTPTPVSGALIDPVTDKDWTKGPSDAYVTILDYSDFQ